MRRLHLLFLATLPLCRARSRSFSIHDDALAFPQFEVVFSDDYISEKDAQFLLENTAPHPTFSADSSQPTIGEGASADEDSNGSPAGKAGSSLTYEVVNMTPHRYLCSIPIIEPPGPENQTATELAKADEARELSRAAVRGWGLLSQLENTCLYFMSGWWSYEFCNNHEIVQFHALPSTPHGQPPRRDPHSREYVLGSIPAIPASSETHSKPVPAELQVKGDQRYLVQKLEGGTDCDLTGRPRTIEVQYHCVPGMQSDRIGWIKEVTICAYLMVINTPRLCDDVAFLPPEENKANPITCQLISDGENPSLPLLEQSSTTHFDQATAQTESQNWEGKVDDGQSLTIGGVVIGGRKVISGADKDGQPAVTLSPPRNYLGSQTAAKELIQVLVHAASKEDGGKIEKLSTEELEKLNLKPDVIEEMQEQMRQLAGDAGWQLEVVGGMEDEDRELRGWLHTDDEQAGHGAATKAGAAKAKAKGEKADAKKGKKKQDGKENGQQDEDGSQEQFFKEAL